MGSPKALLEYRGETFLDRLIGLFSHCSSPVVAVLGAHAEVVRAGLRRAGDAVLVENPGYRLGQLTSMQCGLRAIPPDAAGVLFTLADHPAVEPSTLAALLAQGLSHALRIPRYRGRRGHPIWFSASLIPEFLALPVTSSAREVITRHTEEIAYLDLNDPGILADIDDPVAYRTLLSDCLP